MKTYIASYLRMMAGLTLLALLLWANSAYSVSYISAHYGYMGSEQGYLANSADEESIEQGIDLNFLAWRRQRTGYFARGPRIHWRQAEHSNQYVFTVPLYHWTADHGAFFEYDYQEWRLNTNWSQSQIYLQEQGSAVTTGIGNSEIESEQTRYQVYWYEGVNHEGPINRVGFSYIQIQTPASAKITGLNVDLFDAQFTGLGIQLGRIKQDPGFNFQWLLDIYNIQTDFSNAVTQHRSLSSSESEDYRFHLDLSWHYRYRIEPYWYWVPEIGYRVVYQTQSAMETSILEHDAYTSVDWYARLGLQWTF